jgi:capsular polysaccharide export protein
MQWMNLYHRWFGRGNAVRFKTGRMQAFGFHINDWKQSFLQDCHPEYEFIFVPFSVYRDAEKAARWKSILARHPNAKCFIWGLNVPDFLERLTHSKTFIEDGFIRSVELGSKHTLPYSLVYDTKTLYFNSTQESGLEALCSTYDFDSNLNLLKRARALREAIVDLGISKYNNSLPVDASEIYGPKSGKRILVIGQVEDDASIVYGASQAYTNNDLVAVVRSENPGAQLFYKPHPDVVAGKRDCLSNPEDVSHLCEILYDDMPLADTFATIDHVYVITSQAGFEALLHGIPVTCLGAPFYSGWGLTDDRQPVSRRSRILSLDELFAAAYILYPTYYIPRDFRVVDPEEALEDLVLSRDLHLKAK